MEYRSNTLRVLCPEIAIASCAGTPALLSAVIAECRVNLVVDLAGNDPTPSRVLLEHEIPEVDHARIRRDLAKTIGAPERRDPPVDGGGGRAILPLPPGVGDALELRTRDAIGLELP